MPAKANLAPSSNATRLSPSLERSVNNFTYFSTDTMSPEWCYQKERNPSFIMSIITQPGTLTALYALKTASHLTCLDSRCSDTWLTLHKDHSRCHWQQRSMPAPEYKDMHSMLHSVTTYHWMGDSVLMLSQARLSTNNDVLYPSPYYIAVYSQGRYSEDEILYGRKSKTMSTGPAPQPAAGTRAMDQSGGTRTASSLWHWLITSISRRSTVSLQRRHPAYGAGTHQRTSSRSFTTQNSSQWFNAKNQHASSRRTFLE